MYFIPGCRTKKAQIPGSVFGQVVGKNSCNLNAVKQGTNTQIEIDKVSKQSATRTLTIRLVSTGFYRGKGRGGGGANSPSSPPINY